MLQELGRHYGADGVAAQVFRPGVTVSISVEAGDGVGAAWLQVPAQHIAITHTGSIPHHVKLPASTSADASIATLLIPGDWIVGGVAACQRHVAQDSHAWEGEQASPGTASPDSGDDPDVALVLAAYAAYAAGNIEQAVVGLLPDVEWIEPQESPGGDIVVLHHVYGRLADGTSQDVTPADVYTVRNGQVARMKAYVSPAMSRLTHGSCRR